MSTITVLFLLAAMVAIGLLTLHKVRSIHKSTYRLLEDVAEVRRESEALYGQIQATASLQHVLQLTAPLPAMRGWAGSPDFLLHLAEHLQQHKPQAVLECSSGVSTLVAARCLQLNGQGHVWSLEHDAEFAGKTRALIARHGLSDWATVLDAPLEPDSEGRRWYGDAVLPAAMGPVGVLVVDGPPQSTGPLARAPAFERLRSRLAPGAHIFVDDADRPDEQAMVAQWLQAEPRLNVERPPAEKGLAVVALPG